MVYEENYRLMEEYDEAGLEWFALNTAALAAAGSNEGGGASE